MSNRSAKEFFVGYLPMPVGHRGFVRLLVPTLLWGLCALSALVAWRMPGAGRGSWDLANVVELQGVLSADPYAGILVDRQGGGDPELVLLVEEGKMPLRSGLDALAGRRATARGTVLERDGRRMLELLPAEEGLALESDGPEAPAARESRGPKLNTMVVGEIVDFKCYLGAMKPGSGVTHRGCAALCVQGGIPPALVAPNADGSETVYLLATDNGDRANTLALPFVGGPARVRGLVYEAPGGYEVIRIAPGGLSAP